MLTQANEDTIMKYAAILGLVAATLALGGCQNEPEETPSLEEAIPLDPEPVPDIDTMDDASGGKDSGSGTATGPSNLPSTMESGSNPPGMTAPPPGSKVQRAD